MKILRISLRNIASLAGEHTVDFTKAPLANAGLFAISGPTGSGKSTLLDVLCLALYDQTPRMSVVVGAAAVEDAGKEVQQSDVRNLLRRDCGEGYAEVAFVGVDGLTYTACWVVRRAQGKAGRTLQNTQHSLFKTNAPYGTERELATDGTRTEIKKQIAAKVGLSFDQFRRAVLLAQGDFATFLKAKDTERAEILQALTGTERFEKISIAVYERHKKEEALVENIRSQIGASQPLSREARAGADEELRQAVALKVGLDNQLAGRKKQLEWFALEADHNRKLGEASGRVRELLSLAEADQPRARELHWVRTAAIEAGPKRAAEKQAQAALAEALKREGELTERDGVLQLAAQAAEERHKAAAQALEELGRRQRELAGDLAKARMLDGELTPLAAAVSLANTEHTRAQEAFSKAEKDLSSLNAELAALQKNKQLLQKRLSKVACFQPFAREVEVWLERFKTEQKARTKRDQLQKRVAHSSTEAAKAARRLGDISSTLPALREKLALSETAWREASEKAALFHPEELLLQRRKASGLQAALHALRAHLENQKRLLAEKAGCIDALGTLETQIRDENARSEHLRTRQIPEAQAILTQAQESLRLGEAAVSEHAVVFRRALVSGEACPVCGSLEHPNAGGENSPQSAVLDALRRDVTAKEETLRKLQAELTGADVRIEERKRQEQKLRRDLEGLQTRLTELEGYKPEVAEAEVIFNKPEAQQDPALRRCEANTLELLESLDRADAERIKADKILKSARADHDQKGTEVRAAEAAEGEARNANLAAETERNSAQAELAVLEVEHASAMGVVAPVLNALNGAQELRGVGAEAGNRHGFEEAATAYLDWFESGAKEWNAAMQLLEETSQIEGSKLEQLKPSQDGLEATRGALATRRTEQVTAQGNLAGKRALRAALLDGRTVDEAEAAMAGALESAGGAEARAAREFADAKSKQSNNRELLGDLQKRASSLEEGLRTATAALDEWVGTFEAREGRETGRSDVDGWLGRDAEWIEREQRELDDAAHRLSLAQGMESALRKERDAHLERKSTEDDLETTKNEAARLSAEVTAAGDAVDAKRAAVLSDDEKNRQTGELMRSLEARQKQWDPWQKLNQLIGSADGTRFRNIAQQWTLEVLLRHANAQLVLLSGRYRLERLRDSLNLLVTDLEMDGQQRSVHSLSGGESFLVSLGLALGLASLTSSRLLIESLFIDEGFGSLDSETLRVALNALSHLESQGRKVGVISHVSEMVDAIPVQVRVVRGPGGASKIVV
jgi:exonuclease SbcC